MIHQYLRMNMCIFLVKYVISEDTTTAGTTGTQTYYKNTKNCFAYISLDKNQIIAPIFFPYFYAISFHLICRLRQDLLDQCQDDNVLSASMATFLLLFFILQFYKNEYIRLLKVNISHFQQYILCPFFILRLILPLKGFTVNTKCCLNISAYKNILSYSSRSY